MPRIRQAIILFCRTLGLPSLLMACTTPNQVKFLATVDALRAPTLPTTQTFWIVSGMPGVSENDLQFQESRRLLDNVLKQQGFIVAVSPDSAALAIFLSYGIGNPVQQTYTYLAPQIGLVPQGNTTTGTITTLGNTSTISTTSTAQSQLGITGLTNAVGTYTTYTRYLLVSAIDLDHYRVTKTVKELWKTAVVSTGMSGDLRLVLPYLMVASRPYLGMSTDHVINQIIREDDPRVTALKKLP